MSLEAIEHVGMDGEGRVVTTTRDGKISRTSLVGKELRTETVFDLSSMRPEPIVAPENATKWR